MPSKTPLGILEVLVGTVTSVNESDPAKAFGEREVTPLGITTAPSHSTDPVSSSLVISMKPPPRHRETPLPEPE